MNFEFDTGRVYIIKDKEKKVTLSKHSAKPEGWDNVFALVKKAKVPDTFLDEQERNQGIVQGEPFTKMDQPCTHSMPIR